MLLSRRMADNLRRAIEGEGDRLADLHLWRLGPGHLGAIVSVVTPTARSEADYRAKLARLVLLEKDRVCLAIDRNVGRERVRLRNLVDQFQESVALAKRKDLARAVRSHGLDQDG